VTVGREFAADLERVRAALSHQIPDGRLEAVLHHCLRVTLEVCERRRRGSGRASPGKTSSSRTRYVSAAVRDEVWRRDGGSCAFVSADGRRCGSTFLLQVHHIVPFAVGGPATAANCELRCAGHNRHQARKELGEERVTRKIAHRRQAGRGGIGPDGA
jgi:5-methylcytosine-specific restriction endonuclease McrA